MQPPSTRSILILVSAEMLGATKGLGFSVFDFQHRDDIPEMYGTILVLITIGVITNFSLVHFEKRFNRWESGIAGKLTVCLKFNRTRWRY